MPRLSVAVGLALPATLLAFVGRSTLLPFDNLFYDIGLTSRPANAPKGIIILGIDEAFMKGRHAYLAPRDRLAKLIRNVVDGKPKGIAVDVWLDSRIDNAPGGADAQLKAALAYARSRNVPVILADAPNFTEVAGETGRGQTAHGSVLPFFAQEAQVGDVIFRSDADDVIRQHGRFPSVMASLPVKMAELDGVSQRQLAADFVSSARTPITFSGPPGTIPRESAFDFLEPALSQLLQGKLVFIGATYPRSADLLRTPYSEMGGKSMYGVEVLAQATQDIRSGLPRRPHESAPADLQDFVIVFLIALFVAFAALRGTALGVTAAVALLTIGAVAAIYSARDITPLWGFRYHPFSPFLIALPLAASGGIAWRGIIEGRELRRVRDTFGAYVGTEVLENLGGKMPELGGETRLIAVLFCDIRGYSALAESMNNDPKALLDELNAHFTPLVAALKKRGAYVDNYVGDLVMALFGAPFSSGSYRSDVRGAVLAALDFVEIVESRNVTRREQGLLPIEVGIGVHCGEAVVGNMGSTDAQNGGKIHYTAIGDVVNVASRIESATRGQNVPLLVTREVVETCGENEGMPVWSRIGEVQVKGRAAPVEIYKMAESQQKRGDVPDYAAP